MPERLLGQLFGSVEVDAQVDDRAWLRAMLDAESALATAAAAAGVVTREAAKAVVDACDSAVFDIDELGRAAVESGTPVLPLVERLRAAVPEDSRAAVHVGATSQDILDTAMSLVAHRALRVILESLRGVAGACAGLAMAHRDSVMPARTLLQQAVVTTFGLKCAGWLTAVDEARAALIRVREERLAVQLGGAAGTFAALDVVQTYARTLGLVTPVVPWHTDRTRVADLASALGAATGVLGKIGVDVVLLAQTEVAEVAEGDAGPSSAMPHKRNPVRAVLAVACAGRAPALVATVLGAMPQEHERAAGAWHAEWEPVAELLRLCGGAAAHVHRALGGLRVDTVRMAVNCEALQSTDSGGAAALVDRALAAHNALERTLRPTVS